MYKRFTSAREEVKPTCGIGCDGFLHGSDIIAGNDVAGNNIRN